MIDYGLETKLGGNVAGVDEVGRGAWAGPVFAAAAVLTPPDPVTQIGLAIPLLLLYELSIISVKFIEKKNKEKNA